MKDWFQQNRWLGMFLIAFGVFTLIALILLFATKSSYERAFARFNEAAAERSRLERLDPFPSDANYKKMKVHIETYSAALDKFKEELKTHVLPAPPLAPNEFQSRLRQAITATSEKARANKVRLPDNFLLGFDEFASALPSTAAAPLLGQELSQMQALMNILIDARVDSVTALRRTPLAEEHGAAPPTGAGPGKKPAGGAATGPKMLERGVVDLTFTAAPSASRKVINQIAAANDQLYVIRTLHVRNEKDKGPARAPAAGTAPGTPVQPAPNTPLNFIVGNEHIETSARIEIVRFTF